MIEVRMTQVRMRQLEHDLHIANEVMKLLKEKGAPVEGSFFPRVTSGTLTFSCDEFDTGDYIYRWRE